MKRILAFCLAAVMCLSLCACGANHDLTITNQTGEKVVAVYISDPSESSWGEHLNVADISNGSSVGIDFKKFDGEPGEYDLAMLDEDDMIYEVYGVDLAVGDTVVFAVSGGSTVVTVTAVNGSSTEYDGYSYVVDRS